MRSEQLWVPPVASRFRTPRVPTAQAHSIERCAAVCNPTHEPPSARSTNLHVFLAGSPIKVYPPCLFSNRRSSVSEMKKSRRSGNHMASAYANPALGWNLSVSAWLACTDWEEVLTACWRRWPLPSPLATEQGLTVARTSLAYYLHDQISNFTLLSSFFW